VRSGREEVCTERHQDNLPFDLPNQPRAHLLKSLYGPKLERFVKERDRLEVEGRRTHAGMLNPIFVERLNGVITSGDRIAGDVHDTPAASLAAPPPPPRGPASTVS
jgi:hypothetical protein